MKVCLLDHGSLTECNFTWLLTTPFFWRSVTLIDSDRMSRPDYVLSVKTILLDVYNASAYNVVIAPYLNAGGDFVDKYGLLNRIAFLNVVDMLYKEGLLIISLSEALQRVWEIKHNIHDRRKIKTLVRDAVAGLQIGLVPVTSYKSAFIVPYVTHFFHVADRASAIEKINSDFQSDQILIFKKHIIPHTIAARTTHAPNIQDSGCLVDSA